MYLKNKIKEGIVNAIREHIVTKGGRITPTAKDTTIELDYYGEIQKHHISGMYVTDEGIVAVESHHDGESDYDNLNHFSNDEMLKIVELFY